MTDTTTEPLPERDPTTDLVPSERLLLRTIRDLGDCSRTEAIAESGLPENTARDAASRLIEKGHLERRPEPTDPRRKRWVLPE